MTPDSLISSQRSLPSRVRSPTPANTENPPCCFATLLISSMMTTVLPTPAPPKRPIFPPFKNGWIRSTTFTPVSYISAVVDCSSNASESAAAYGSGDGSTLIDRFHAAHHAVGCFHGDAAHPAFAEMLLHFENDVDGGRDSKAVTDDTEGLIDGRHGRFGELDVHGGAGDLDDVPDIF